MKRFLHFVVGAVVLFSWITGISGQVTPDSDLQKFGEEFTPDGMEAAHKTVRGRFAESASTDGSGHVVVLSRPVSGVRTYRAAVVLLRRADSFDYRQLPEPQSTWSMMEPTAVFFANADGDTENELFIIDECYTGIGPDGAKPFYRTRVYDWNGSGFAHLEDLSEKIGNLNTAPKVRTKLSQIARTSKPKPTEMFQTSDFAAHNAKIEKAAAAKEEWVKLPMQIVARTLGEFSDMRSRSIEMTAPTADGPDSLTVIIINDGYLDDSVRGEKFKYELRANEQGVWKFTSAGKAWRCQPGRGSQNFTTVKCM
jgi:hypothetical protein